jgi:cytoskeletal protein CcmA (bactofilin family)
MWKKEDVPAPVPAPRSETPPATGRPEPAATPSERATIGRSITIRGDVTGDEDLLVQGRVDGSIDLKQHAVTVGAEGEVKASVTGRIVIVEGRLEGNISSDEQVILRSSAWVTGDITSPRVVLEDGARFRGGVDMGDAVDGATAPDDVTSTQAKRGAVRASSVPPALGGPTEEGKSGTDTAVDFAT